MINTIIFDFGNVFINLDIEGSKKQAHKTLCIEAISPEMNKYNSLYEQELISTHTFLDFYCNKFKGLSRQQLVDLWNYMLKDFPKYRLDFLKKLKATAKYKILLLSNTNELHIDWIKENVSFYEDFKNCFDAFYLSHEIHLVKPNQDIFEFVLKENNLRPEECLFIDDNLDNIKSANTLNLKTWHINPNTEDVVNLFKVKAHLFE